MMDITPIPTDEEVAAIVAAIEMSRPRTSADERRPPDRWKFSGRWWSRPVPTRRIRPW